MIEKCWNVRGVWLILGKIGLRLYPNTTRRNAKHEYRLECKEA